MTYFLVVKKAKQDKCDDDCVEQSEGEEEQECAKEVFQGEDDDDYDDDEECDGPELPSGLTGEEEPLFVCV